MVLAKKWDVYVFWVDKQNLRFGMGHSEIYDKDIAMEYQL